MLSFFRRALSSWVIIGLLGLLMVAFIVTGVGTPSSMGSLGGASSADIARAGDRSLSVTDVSQRMQLELRQAKEQQPETTMALLLQGGALEQLVDQLIDLLSIRAFGEAHGMTVSDKLGDAEIASIPAFQGATGMFDDSRYRQALSTRGITPEEFRADIDQSIAIRHLLVPISASAGAPRDLVLPYASLLVERRSGTVIDFRNSAFAAGPTPTEAQLTAFYAANRARYTVPEQRVIRYAVIDKTMIAKSATATETEIAAQYKKDAAKYAAREKRDLTQIIVQDERTAQAIFRKVAAGGTMADAAKTAQADAILLEAREKASFAEQSSPSVAEAAFGAAQGRIVGPIKSGLGWHIIRVDAVKNLGGKTLAQARAEIAAAISTQKAADAFANLLADVENAVSDGQTFDDVVKSRGLTVVSTPALTAGGTAISQASYRLDPSFAPMLKDAFQAELDDDPAIIPLSDSKDVFYDLDRVIAAAPKPLSAIRATVLADFVADRASKAARKAAETALAKAKAGAPLTSLGGSTRTLSLRRADILKQGTAPTPDVQQLFDLGLGKANIVRTADKQGWMLVKLDRIEVGDLRSDPSLVAATQSQLSNAIGQEYTAQFASAVKAAMKTERNEDAIRDLRRTLAGSAGR
ncbi:MAG: hypothetical protein RLZZ561_1898 [Pseudomonadota bacterium]|jgi:peptidyl-prolyl cis-trans isomerase D